MSLKFVADDGAAIDLHIIDSVDFDDWCESQNGFVQNWVEMSGFAAKLGSVLVVPNKGGGVSMALAGYGNAEARKRGRFHLATAAAKLPAGNYRLFGLTDKGLLEQEALGWLLSGYRFDRYREQKPPMARLVVPDGVDSARLEIIAAGECLTRDLINTPANDMGPEHLEGAVSALADDFGARMVVIEGADLIAQNFPLIHAVGRASPQSPRLIDMNWGETGPHLTLVGKGVCFDTGGLNLKPGASMGLMKKDMGGAAAVLGLAYMIMALGLKLRLRVLIPAVENAVSGDAFRPGDILTSRKGLTVEINNTDAEGRLVLADALAYGAEDSPDLMISMATLTGAARVAVGPDIAPYFCDEVNVSQALENGAARVGDPVWRLPFWDPYEGMIEPGIADLDNAPKGGFAGTITAALFLRRFTSGDERYCHFDIYGHQPTNAPARPKGGVGQATRAILSALPQILELSDG